MWIIKKHLLPPWTRVGSWLLDPCQWSTQATDRWFTSAEVLRFNLWAVVIGWILTQLILFSFPSHYSFILFRWVMFSLEYNCLRSTLLYLFSYRNDCFFLIPNSSTTDSYSNSPFPSRLGWLGRKNPIWLLAVYKLLLMYERWRYGPHHLLNWEKLPVSYLISIGVVEYFLPLE